MYELFGGNPFDLMAEVLRLAEQKRKSSHWYTPTLEADERCGKEARKLLEPYDKELKLAATIGLDLQAIAAIIRQCETKEFYVLYKILQELDYFFSWEQFCEAIDEAKSFRALNDNIEETGIRILPRVKIPQFAYEGHLRRDARSFCDYINANLQNCYYIKEENLNVDGIKYELENVIYQPEIKGKDRESLTIAFSPLTNLPLDDILQINYFAERDENGLEQNYFSAEGVKWPELCFEKYKKLYQCACEFDADIVMAPEMLGVDGLYKLDKLKFNENSHEWSKAKMKKGNRVPSLVLTPTYCKNGRNSVRVFDKYGKMLLEQDKQYPFVYRKKDALMEKLYTENLKNCENRIVMLHVPHWGRMVFPICMDFLNPSYQNVLIRVLQATLVLCPSYSNGATNFEAALSTGVQFQTTSLWGNSCSALQPHLVDCGYVGAVRLPNVGTNASPVRFELDCKGKCMKECAFIVHLPLNYAGISRWQDCTAKCYHHHGL